MRSEIVHQFGQSDAAIISFGRENPATGRLQLVAPLRQRFFTTGNPQGLGISGLYKFRGKRQTQSAIEHHPNRRTLFQPRQAAVQHRIVGQCGFDANQDNIGLGPQDMRLGARNRPRYCKLSLAPTADHAIGGKCKFQNHFRALLRRSIQIARKIIGSLFGKNAWHNLNPCLAQNGKASSADPFVRIGRGNHDTRHPCPHQRFRARGCASVMRTRFQRHISRRATRHFSRVCKRLRLGMGPAANCSHATSDDDTILDDDRANGRIGSRQPLVTPCITDRRFHEADVIRSCIRRRKLAATHA